MLHNINVNCCRDKGTVRFINSISKNKRATFFAYIEAS